MLVQLVTASALAAILWQQVRPGLWQFERSMAKKGALASVRAIAIRIDPRLHEIRLAVARNDYGLRPAWTIDSIPEHAVVAVNAGQFTAGFPWGWLVRDGIESQAKGTGALAMSFVVNRQGQVALFTPGEVDSSRGEAWSAFQSYPALLVDGKLPYELRAPGRGVDLTHRDSRLAVCTLQNRQIVIVLTRVSAFGDAGATLPWGPTVPEMAAYMRSIGCNRAMLLDGGISSQLAVRARDGKLKRWTNWRKVPLGLVVSPRN